MKLDKNDIEIIKNMFAEMQTRQDLLELLNFVKPFIYGKNSIPFELKQITWHSNPTINKNRYRSFSIKKKSGNERVIHAPKKGLKSIQRVLGVVLQCLFEPHDATMGFVRGKSIVHNAKVHVSSRYVYNIDLRDFFHSIDQARFWKCLQLKPFSLVDNTFDANGQKVVKIYTGIREFITDHGEKIFYKIEDDFLIFIPDKNGNLNRYKERLSEHLNKPIQSEYTSKEDFVKASQEYRLSVNSLIFDDAHRYILTEENERVLKGMVASRSKLANIIASLCCNEITVERKNIYNEWQTVNKNVTPQGAPTSPIVSNIVCQRLDFLLTGVAKRFGLKYSRYADDITFSSMHNVYQQDGDFIKELNRIVSEQGFTIKESKTRLQKDGYRKEVTGLLVNEKANVQKRYIKQLRMWLYYWERYGYERASRFFLEQYTADKGHVKKGKPDMANVISGKLDYLKMVKGGDNELYLKLKERFHIQTGKNSSIIKTVVQPLAASDMNSLMEKFFLPDYEQPIHVQNSNEETFESISPEKPLIPIIHHPKLLVGLLSKFSENSHPLKYACHSWEDGRVEDLFQDYLDFIKKFDELGRSVCFEIQKIKKPLGTKILHFLNTVNEDGKYYINDKPQEYYWGEYRMRYGWKSKELSNWARENPMIDPFEFPLPIKSIINKRSRDIEISKFGDIIRIFKDEIEVRPEESALYNLFADLRRKYLSLDFRVVLNENLKGKQFYTDVHDFKRAVSKIFREISVRTMYPNVSISADNFPQHGYTIIEILHHESYSSEKSSEEIMKEIYDGDFADIIKYLENLCDWSIESKFQDGFFRINYLSSSVSDLPKESIDNADGFKHIFKFYKK